MWWHVPKKMLLIQLCHSRQCGLLPNPAVAARTDKNSKARKTAPRIQDIRRCTEDKKHIRNPTTLWSIPSLEAVVPVLDKMYKNPVRTESVPCATCHAGIHAEISSCRKLWKEMKRGTAMKLYFTLWSSIALAIILTEFTKRRLPMYRTYVQRMKNQ